MHFSIMGNNHRMALEYGALPGPLDARYISKFPVLKNPGETIWPSNLKEVTDTLHLSYQAKTLHLHISGQDAADKPAASWKEQIKDSRADPTLKLIDKHIAKAGDILEQMKEFAKLAQDETLSDDDRLALQMNIDRLQYELDCETERMCNKYYYGKAIVQHHEQRYEDTRSYKMLARAAERLANGEKWDVAELLNHDLEWEILEDPDAPTVGDILKGKGRSVMDFEAARVTEAELDNDLSKLQKQRDKFIAFVEKNGPNPQGTDTGENNDSNAVYSLFAGALNFLCTLSRDAVEYITGPGKDKKAEYGVEDKPKIIEEYYDFSMKSSEIPNKPVADDVLMATVVHSKLNSTWSLNIQISISDESPANAGTKTVLRPDPNEIVIPNTIGRRVVATTITDQDPEFYIETPRVNAIYIDANSRLSSAAIEGYSQWYKASPSVPPEIMAA
jgi:hypothetical protein